MDNSLEKIYDAGLKFLDHMSLEETYATIVKEALKLVQSESGSILLMDNGEFKRVYSSDPKWAAIKTRKKGFSYQVYKTGKARIISTAELKKVHPEVSETEMRSTIVVPLSYHGKTIGVLNIQSTKNNHFSDKELELLKLFSPLASLAITKTEHYEETKKALELRDSFIAMASHELRTPLTTINGYVQLLYNKLVDQNNSESRWVTELSWETFRLTQLVKDLLELNRIKAGQIDYAWEECSLTVIILSAIHNFSQTYPDRNFQFSNKIADGSDIVIGDKEKLVQVVNSILENAVKFSLTDQSILIDLKKKGDYDILTIQDQGQGINKDELSKVFDGYYRGSNHQREGLGMGLYLAKYIVEKHKGIITIQSKVNKGTKVEIRLPSAKL